MDQLKFFLQYLLMPLVLAVVGYFFTSNQQSSQRRLEEMKFTEQIIKDAYDTSNSARGLAICNLIKPALRSNPEYADSLISSINAFYASRVKLAIANGNIPAAKEIVSTSNSIGGDAAGTAQEVQQTKLISKGEKAGEFEEKGIQYLNDNNIPAAQNAFASAESSYHGFHNANEISKLLKTTKPEELESAKKIIKTRYSWGMDKTIN